MKELTAPYDLIEALNEANIIQTEATREATFRTHPALSLFFPWYQAHKDVKGKDYSLAEWRLASEITGIDVEENADKIDLRPSSNQ